jgi:hypothetical protein
MNTSEKELRSNVETLKGVSGKLPRRYYFYSGPADFVLREGEFFKPAPLPKKIKAQTIRLCFHNSLLISIGHGFRYVEGYALHKGKIPVLHAWNIDSDGFVIDTTWRPIGRAYLGVVLPIVCSLNWKGSLIDDWENGWPLLRKRLR